MKNPPKGTSADFFTCRTCSGFDSGYCSDSDSGSGSGSDSDSGSDSGSYSDSASCFRYSWSLSLNCLRSSSQI